MKLFGENHTFLKSFLAGMCISLGGTVFLLSEQKVIGALFFSCGLFFILSFKLDLFTGKVCYVLSNDKNYAARLPVIWAGNFAGSFCTAFLMKCTRNAEQITEKAAVLCAAKSKDHMISLLVLGFFCNILIYFAVEGYQRLNSDLGKHLSILFGVMVFILSGYEHCVADMFYFSVAGSLNIDSLLRLLVITVGNCAGGIFAHEVIGKASLSSQKKQ